MMEAPLRARFRDVVNLGDVVRHQNLVSWSGLRYGFGDCKACAFCRCKPCEFNLTRKRGMLLQDPATGLLSTVRPANFDEKGAMYYTQAGSSEIPPSTAGNSITSSERPSPEPFLKKEASQPYWGGENSSNALQAASLKCLELCYGASQPYSRGEFQETLERFRGLSGIFPEFLLESRSHTGGIAQFQGVPEACARLHANFGELLAKFGTHNPPWHYQSSGEGPEFRRRSAPRLVHRR